MNQNSLLDIAAFSPRSLQSPSAWLGHLPFAGWVIQEISPKIFVELGTHSGNSYFAFCQSVVEAGISTRCYAVDTWQGDKHTGQYDDETFAKVSAHHQEHYAGFSRLLRMTFDDAVAYFADKSIELLHVDGLHTYEAVHHDFETWLPKLAPGAVVMFHDTNVRERNFGVWKLWKELQVRYPDNLEFVHSHGLGVLQLNSAPDNKKLEWLQPSSPEKQRLINYFAALGSRQLERFELDELKQHAASLNQAVVERDRQIASLDQAITERDGHIERILSSNSWKVSAPMRWIGHRIRRVRELIACLAPLWHDPRKIPSTVIRVRFAWGRGGMLAVKQLLLQLPIEVSFNDVWLQYRQTFTPDVEADIRERIGGMEGRPLISILMPVYNTPAGVLRKTIESVLAQLYADWELCVVDDASPQPEVRRILEEFSASDSRIRVEFSERNSGIARATNRALAVARGSFVALLDHDDVLEKQALFRLAESILADDPDMIYSDEAMLSEDGVEVVNHVYRPAFSPERLRSCPYIVHLVAFRTDLLREIGGLDASLAISQDYDLILRASEKARAIVHIPEILYLWRQRKRSTGHKMKEGVMETSRQVLARHLERCGERGEIRDGLLFNYYEVRYPIEPGQRVAIIIPTKNHGELVRQCVESIERTVSGVPYDIVVIDHASTDPESLAYFRQLSDRHRLLRYEGPFNFSSINNWAVAQLDGEYTHYLFCNNDIEATEAGWLERMMELCQKPDVGMVGAKLFYPDGRTFQHAGVCVGMFGIAEHYAKFLDDRLPNGGIHPGYHGTLIANHEVSAVTAACALMRRDAFERIGGFDEAIAVGFGDVDLCLRTLEAGYRILFCPHASLIHHESSTRGKSHGDPHPEDSALFTRKWRKFLDRGDPYYNPNLTLYSTQWEIRQPMEFNLRIGRRVIHRHPAAPGSARAFRQNTG